MAGVQLENEFDYLEEDTQKDKYLTFNLGKQTYGIDISYVTEILVIQPITEVPELPDYVQGIINLRGRIIPVIDVRVRFKKEFKDYTDRTCVIVIEIRDISLGLIVDNVAEVINIPEENIVLPPDASTGFSNRYIKGIGKTGEKVKLILDCNLLLKDDEIEELVEIA